MEYARFSIKRSESAAFFVFDRTLHPNPLFPIMEMLWPYSFFFIVFWRLGLSSISSSNTVWRQVRRLARPLADEHPFVSVIVAARNEEKNVLPLLECLSRQTYATYEIIIVNDRSTDSTAQLIHDFRKNKSQITCIDIEALQDDMPSKKNALRAGIEASKGEILCFTDADCLPPPQWIEALIRSFSPEVGLVAGYSPYHAPSGLHYNAGILEKIFFKFIAYEEYRAATWAAGSIGWNAGWLCTGRNLAYRRTVYNEVNGYERIKMSVSGDDDLFLQLVRMQTGWNIRYITVQRKFCADCSPAGFLVVRRTAEAPFFCCKVFSHPDETFLLFVPCIKCIALPCTLPLVRRHHRRPDRACMHYRKSSGRHAVIPFYISDFRCRRFSPFLHFHGSMVRPV